MVRTVGDAALLIDVADPDTADGAGVAGPGDASPGDASSGDAGSAAAVAAGIAARGFPGVVDVVPGARSVLVVTEPGNWDLAELARQISALPATPAPARDRPTVEIPVSYDGPDLAEVARLSGLSVAEVIARHQAAEYRVGWLGFAPGFGYLTGLDPALAQVPRLDTPRLSVPAGSVAIAGGLAAVYPAASPGGWQLLGRTFARLWDPAGQPPAVLSPGTRVRFRAAEPPAAEPQAAEFQADAEPQAEAPGDPRWLAGPVEVLRPGPLATVQDLGRTGYGHLGVPRGGAADADSLRRANRLVGNPDGAAGLEFTLGRAALRFHADAVVAVTGAPAPLTITAGPDTASPDTTGPGSTGPGTGDPGTASAGAREAESDAALIVPAGCVLRLGAPGTGLRTYLAIRGGIDGPAVLGSRSADLLSGLGPRPLRAGDRLPVGPTGPGSPVGPAPTAPARDHNHGTSAAAGAGDAPAGDDSPGGIVTLRITVGPRDDWFDPAALRALTGAAYRVTPASNRTGLRLAGPAVTRSRRGELPSEGMVAGALQVPPDGQPILLLADHPATGGYPVIAVVCSADIGRAAQLRPGQLVRFAVLARVEHG